MPDCLLITGASGFVGRYFTPAAKARFPNAQIFAVSRSGRAGDRTCDLTVRTDVMNLLADVRPDAIVHLAAQSSVGAGDNFTTWRDNLLSVLNLAEAIGTHTPECKLLFASSTEVYGRAFKLGEVDEDTLRQPASAYSRSKAAGEDLLLDVLPASTRIVVTRASNHSGAGQDERFVIPSFAAQIARIEMGADPVIKVGNLMALRDFLHVRDVVDAYLELLDSSNLPRISIFNIASGRLVRVADVLERLRAMSSRDVEVIIDRNRMRPSDVAETKINFNRIGEAITWHAHRTLDDILTDVLSDQRRLARGVSTPQGN